MREGHRPKQQLLPGEIWGSPKISPESISPEQAAKPPEGQRKRRANPYVYPRPPWFKLIQIREIAEFAW